MTRLDTPSILKRIDQLLDVPDPGDDPSGHATVFEVFQGTLTLARAVYGDLGETSQVHTLMKAAQGARSSNRNIAYAFHQYAWPAAQGSLRAMRADVETGLVGNLERRATGEVIADMLGLAKEALGEGSEDAKNVAAVLVAASYEDTVRRMGSTFAGVTGRPGLQDVFIALKSARVLEGASHSNGLSYLKFRNDALHADWSQVDRVVAGACMVWVEDMLEKHFS